MEPTKRVVQLGGSEEAHEDLVKKGIFLLSGEVDDDMTYDFTMSTSVALTRGYLKGRKALILLNSPGGNVQHGLAIYDTIRMLVDCGVHVDVFGMGLVASMGAIIMQAGSRRLASPHTQFLLHQISQTIGYFEAEEVSKGEERVTENKRLNDILLGIVATRSGIDIEELRARVTKRDYWLDPQLARGLGTNGLIDDVVIAPQLFLDMSAS
jgi:ATP-dependent Clp protease protease subunit